MSDPQPAEAVKLITSIFSGGDNLTANAIEALSERYGKTDFISAPFSFAYTDYYVKEFGESLVRRFVAFERLIRPEELPDIKLWTNRLERGTSDEERRKINLDPGYLARSHLILATGKGYSHRPYLRDGIYADLTLLYRDKAFCVLPWTYPDYAGGEIIGMLTRIREKYVLQLKGKAAGGTGAVPAERIINEEIKQ
jgi:hypothetical protein